MSGGTGDGINLANTSAMGDFSFTGGLDIDRDDDAGRTAVTFQPDPGRAVEDNNWRLEFEDSSGVQTREWSYVSAPAEPQPPRVTGHWDFTGGLEATVGQDLEFFSNLAEQQTQFGTTEDFGVSSIGGEVAEVMAVPGARHIAEVGARGQPYWHGANRSRHGRAL